uniref:Ribosomal RNA methyltransferase FtsJ domain-containing protein n=1 Tax=Chromera velia CCMP2878 TaxID=1169474 RepID=A0A0G4FUW0_9ALVE|eukprot:Cvel_18887.t1-p1 / transcript=Cvel_18887.t1 / gene=Cvel_18887 / organism=Chromera_velia_CCMP2878 / gene_product=hypothetical protein / transcript_product=hypothetical protein / location=Cvel_scaffold1591:12727-20641(+) / protein_length=1552 / sequence_SO=supercontig / SO=protein_coding / is_pseudo=false
MAHCDGVGEAPERLGGEGGDCVLEDDDRYVLFQNSCKETLWASRSWHEKKKYWTRKQWMRRETWQAPEGSHVHFQTCFSVLAEMFEYFQLLGTPIFLPHQFSFIDIACAPGGFSQFLLEGAGGRSVCGWGLGVTLPTNRGGFPLLVEPPVGCSYCVKYMDLLSDPTPSHVPLGAAIGVIDEKVDISLADGQYLGGKEFARGYRSGVGRLEDRENAKLAMLARQLEIGLESLKSAGTLIFRAFASEQMHVNLMRLLLLCRDVFVRVTPFKSEFAHQTSSSFYLVCRGFLRDKYTRLNAAAELRSAYRTLLTAATTKPPPPTKMLPTPPPPASARPTGSLTAPSSALPAEGAVDSKGKEEKAKLDTDRGSVFEQGGHANSARTSPALAPCRTPSLTNTQAHSFRSLPSTPAPPGGGGSATASASCHVPVPPPPPPPRPRDGASVIAEAAAELSKLSGGETDSIKEWKSGGERERGVLEGDGKVTACSSSSLPAVSSAASTGDLASLSLAASSHSASVAALRTPSRDASVKKGRGREGGGPRPSPPFISLPMGSAGSVLRKSLSPRQGTADRGADGTTGVGVSVAGEALTPDATCRRLREHVSMEMNLNAEEEEDEEDEDEDDAVFGDTEQVLIRSSSEIPSPSCPRIPLRSDSPLPADRCVCGFFIRDDTNLVLDGMYPAGKECPRTTTTGSSSSSQCGEKEKETEEEERKKKEKNKAKEKEEKCEYLHPLTDIRSILEYVFRMVAIGESNAFYMQEQEPWGKSEKSKWGEGDEKKRGGKTGRKIETESGPGRGGAGRRHGGAVPRAGGHQNEGPPFSSSSSWKWRGREGNGWGNQWGAKWKSRTNRGAGGGEGGRWGGPFGVSNQTAFPFSSSTSCPPRAGAGASVAADMFMCLPSNGMEGGSFPPFPSFPLPVYPTDMGMNFPFAPQNENGMGMVPPPPPMPAPGANLSLATPQGQGQTQAVAGGVLGSANPLLNPLQQPNMCSSTQYGQQNCDVFFPAIGVVPPLPGPSPPGILPPPQLFSVPPSFPFQPVDPLQISAHCHAPTPLASSSIPLPLQPPMPVVLPPVQLQQQGEANDAEGHKNAQQQTSNPSPSASASAPGNTKQMHQGKGRGKGKQAQTPKPQTEVQKEEKQDSGETGTTAHSVPLSSGQPHPTPQAQTSHAATGTPEDLDGGSLEALIEFAFSGTPPLILRPENAPLLPALHAVLESHGIKMPSLSILPSSSLHYPNPSPPSHLWQHTQPSQQPPMHPVLTHRVQLATQQQQSNRKQKPKHTPKAFSAPQIIAAPPKVPPSPTVFPRPPALLTPPPAEKTDLPASSSSASSSAAPLVAVPAPAQTIQGTSPCPSPQESSFSQAESSNSFPSTHQSTRTNSQAGTASSRKPKKQNNSSSKKQKAATAPQVLKPPLAESKGGGEREKGVQKQRETAEDESGQANMSLESKETEQEKTESERDPTNGPALEGDTWIKSMSKRPSGNPVFRSSGKPAGACKESESPSASATGDSLNASPLPGPPLVAMTPSSRTEKAKTRRGGGKHKQVRKQTAGAGKGHQQEP